MSALPSYTFGGYTLRPAGKEDGALARTWNARDSDHLWEKKFENYWIEQGLGVNSYVLEDVEGTVFFFKMIQLPGEKWIEVSMQFDRPKVPEKQYRVTRATTVGFEWLLKILPANGIEAVYFSSKNKMLIHFFQVRFGFVEVWDDRVSRGAGFRRFMRKV